MTLSRSGLYRLDGHEPVACLTVGEWGEWFEHADRQVARTVCPNGVGVSTVFLGVDIQIHEDGKPHLFETMIFGGRHDQAQWRWATWDDAVEGHAVAVALAEADDPEAA